MKFEEFPKNFLLVGLFMFALLSGAIILASNYGEDASFMLDSRMPFLEIEQQINQSSKDSNTWKDSFSGENPKQESGLLVFRSIWGVMKTIWTSFMLIPNTLFSAAQYYLGIPPVVTGVLSALIIISVIFAMWRIMKGSE